MTEIQDLSQIQRAMLLTTLGNDDILDLKILSTFPTYFRYKGHGRIAVDDVDLAKQILKDHLGHSDLYFDDVYPENFFIEGYQESLPLVHTGKLEIPNISTFLKLLISSGVVLHNYDFDQNSCYCCS